MMGVAVCGLLAVIAVCIAFVAREYVRLRANAAAGDATRARLALGASKAEIDVLRDRLEAVEKSSASTARTLNLAIQAAKVRQ